MMKLSDTTFMIFRNFALINNSIVLKPGKVQRTLAEDKSILAEATLEEDLPFEFGIYDLSTFLGNFPFLDKPDLAFYPETVRLDDGTVKLTYHSCSPSLVTSPGDKSLELPKVNASFSITKEILQKMLKMAFANSLPMFSVVGEKGEIKIRVHDNSDTTNYAETVVSSAYDGADFVTKFKTEHIRMLPDDYDVQIAFGSFALFENTARTLRYFIATQSK